MRIIHKVVFWLAVFMRTSFLSMRYAHKHCKPNGPMHKQDLLCHRHSPRKAECVCATSRYCC